MMTTGDIYSIVIPLWWWHSGRWWWQRRRQQWQWWLFALCRPWSVPWRVNSKISSASIWRCTPSLRWVIIIIIHTFSEDATIWGKGWKWFSFLGKMSIKWVRDHYFGKTMTFFNETPQNRWMEFNLSIQTLSIAFLWWLNTLASWLHLMIMAFDDYADCDDDDGDDGMVWAKIYAD